ncbi:hypothetical protein DICPUDRAFT_33897 [Dictyostelium purpureum]|uniref:Uncharacterized protein n=1 Tax=Dictyostelium purpureum TaxID=5786 RepID=F0ZLM8_DICPU|nr:uncharacterized protein DICPUDRAFT_33897 [Dictyostelium purpureum]EGC35127.1 hypothetical protein DICPUDRAFT_33897 [Dictyostelium purpureum]|eukprot:XP_003288320.1 hypothetical protein DICPUDRAFT_33897 [Dictyostelium purpureum]
MNYFIYLYIFIFIYLFNIVNSAVPTGCIYYNPNVKLNYDLTPLKLTGYQYYSTHFASRTPTFDILYNFCDTQLSSCTDISTSCLKKETDAYPPYNQLSAVGSETQTYTNNGVILSYRKPGSTSSACGTADKYSYLLLNLTCNPLQTFNVIGEGDETVACQYKINIQTKQVCGTCPGCSATHGLCNSNNGICNCDSQTTGTTCTTSRLSIDSIQSTNINGGLTTIKGYFGTPNKFGGIVEICGYFGNITSEFKLWIGNTQCIDIKPNNQTTLTCKINGGTGTKNITIQDRDLYYSSINIFKYTLTKEPLQCPNNCTNTNQGSCNIETGYCKCKYGFSGPDCSGLPIDLISLNNPPSSLNVNYLTSKSIIGNEGTQYSINLYSLVELKIDGSIEIEHPLQDIKWDVQTNSEDNKVKNTIFSSEIKGCTIQYTVEEIKEKIEYTFSNVKFSMDPNSIKTTISIKNYIYKSNLNTLQLRIISSTGGNQTDDCNNKDLNINTNNIKNNQPINYIIMSKDSKIFYTEIVNQHISDGRSTFMSSTFISKNQNDASFIIGLNLAHCVKECIIDPNYSVLVDPNYQSECPSKSNWKLAIMIVAPIVFVTLIIIISSIIYSKNSTAIKLKMYSLKNLFSKIHK